MRDFHEALTRLQPTLSLAWPPLQEAQLRDVHSQIKPFPLPWDEVTSEMPSLAEDVSSAFSDVLILLPKSAWIIRLIETLDKHAPRVHKHLEIIHNIKQIELQTAGFCHSC